MSSARCKRVAPRCDGSTPSVRTLGMKLLWKSTSFAPRRSGFDSRRLHFCLRSVNGKHAPFVRPRCGFDSCRRLLRGRSSVGRARDCHSREARSIRAVRFTGLWCNRQHGELQPRRSGFESWRACCARSSRAGAARLSGESVHRWCRCGSTPQSRPHPHDRDVALCCGPERFRLSTPNRQVAGSTPAWSLVLR